MAVGTVTRVAADPHGVTAAISLGGIKVTVTKVVGTGSYTTNGDALTAAQLGLNTVLFAITDIVASSGSNNTAVKGYYDATNAKLLVLAAADSTGVPVSEASSTTNVSGLTFQVIAFGY